MIIIHFLINATIVAVELGLVAGIAGLAWAQPVLFAAVTGLLALIMGLGLEQRRLAFEMPFYFERSSRFGRFVRLIIASGQAIMKAVVAGLVALMTFSGTEETRLQVVAALFGLTVLIGSMVLRRLTISLGARPTNWGFFRMAAPLGLIFSAAMTLFPAPTSFDVARKVLLELPSRPGIAQAGEALFALRLWIDDLIIRLIAGIAGPAWAQIIGVIIGSNVLAGFVLGLYAVAISEIVRVMEEAHWRLRGLAVRRS